MMTSWPFGLCAMAKSIAPSSAFSPSARRKGAPRSTEALLKPADRLWRDRTRRRAARSIRSLAPLSPRHSSPRFHHPAQDGLHGDDPRIVGLTHQREHLEPQLVSAILDKFANCAGGEISHGHRGVRGPCLELLPNGG